jgi:pimeloyl-[acyl-carrier protein] synthase
MANAHLNLADPAFVADPYPTYHRLRAQDPVHRSPLGFWALTRYDDVATALRDKRFGKEGANLGVVVPGTAPSMLERDPPHHTRLRGLVNKAFTPPVVESMRPHTQQVVDELLDRVEPAGRMDLIADFAFPLPFVVISQMLGVRAEDRDEFRQWGMDLTRGFDAFVLSPDSDVVRRSLVAHGGLVRYFRRSIAERRAAPTGDLLSALVAAEEAGDKLSEGELLSTCVLLLLAGFETTVNLIGNGVRALLAHPDQLRRLRAEPDLIESAVEELARHDSPVQCLRRIAAVDIELGDRTIRKGDLVVPILGAANRDPAQFPDPDRLDLGRADNRHLVFGFGAHYCLGASLGRLEAQLAIGTLLRRFPDLALAGDRAEYRQGLTFRGLVSLPLVF